MYKKLIAVMILSVLFMSVEAGADEVPAGQKKEKSELARLLSNVDEDYKALQAMAGYTEYQDKEWDLVRRSGENILNVANILRRDHSRPEDRKYEKLMKKMQDSAEDLVKLSEDNKKPGAVEDAQMLVRQLQQTCSLCHKHLDIHIYPQLFEGKKSEYKEKQSKK